MLSEIDNPRFFKLRYLAVWDLAPMSAPRALQIWEMSTCQPHLDLDILGSYSNAIEFSCTRKWEQLLDSRKSLTYDLHVGDKYLQAVLLENTCRILEKRIGENSGGS